MDNYWKFGERIGLGDQLEKNPELANDPKIAAKLLANFLKANESGIRDALKNDDLKEARRLVNGGSHGLADFKAAFNAGKKYLEGGDDVQKIPAKRKP